MASEVAVTLCAAYPEVDVSVVHLILAEAGGDAGVAAAQLAVLAGESRPRCVALLCTSCLARCLHDTLWSKPASRRRARRTMKWRSRCSSHVRPWNSLRPRSLTTHHAQPLTFRHQGCWHSRSPRMRLSGLRRGRRRSGRQPSSRQAPPRRPGQACHAGRHSTPAGVATPQGRGRAPAWVAEGMLHHRQGRNTNLGAAAVVARLERQGRHTASLAARLGAGSRPGMLTGVSCRWRRLLRQPMAMCCCLRK